MLIFLYGPTLTSIHDYWKHHKMPFIKSWEEAKLCYSFCWDSQEGVTSAQEGSKSCSSSSESLGENDFLTVGFQGCPSTWENLKEVTYSQPQVND